MNKGGPKKFQFGFPSKKQAATTTLEKPTASETTIENKRKAEFKEKETVKKPRALVVDDDEDEFLASAGIGK